MNDETNGATESGLGLRFLQALVEPGDGFFAGEAVFRVLELSDSPESVLEEGAKHVEALGRVLLRVVASEVGLHESELNDRYPHLDGPCSHWSAKGRTLSDDSGRIVEPEHARDVAREILALADRVEEARKHA